MHHSNDHINRVQCNVKNCMYNIKGQFCGAENIMIKSHDAKNVSDTDCATFALEKGLR